MGLSAPSIASESWNPLYDLHYISLINNIAEKCDFEPVTGMSEEAYEEMILEELYYLKPSERLAAIDSANSYKERMLKTIRNQDCNYLRKTYDSFRDRLQYAVERRIEKYKTLGYIPDPKN